MNRDIKWTYLFYLDTRYGKNELKYMISYAKNKQDKNEYLKFLAYLVPNGKC